MGHAPDPTTSGRPGPGSRPTRARHTAHAAVTAATAALTVLAAVITASPAAAATSRYSPFGHVDQAAFVNGAATVSGWAIDPDHTSGITVVAQVDGATRAAATAAAPRPDLLHAYRRYGDRHGFALRVGIPDGRHRVCITALNRGRGSSTRIGCLTLTGSNDPVGARTAARVPGGVAVTGWAVDPNTAAPTQIRIALDRQASVTVAAAAPAGPDTATIPAALVAHYGSAHAFTATLPTPTPGPHTVCVTAANVGAGHDTNLGCSPVTVTVDPVAQLARIVRVDATHIALTGWALDPDTADPVTVTVTAGGLLAANAVADRPASATDAPIPSPWAAWGPDRYFTGTYPVPAGEQTVCLTAVNVGPGSSRRLTCTYLPAYGATSPPAPAVTVTDTATSVTASWTRPAADGGARLLGYTVALTPGPAAAAVPLTATRRVWTRLTPGRRYTVTVTVTNQVGSTSATRTVTLPVPPPPIPPQTAPAPVSTSHYPRNLTNNVAHDTALMRAMGAADAGYNPSGHRYLVLQDLGGQTGGGILLTATTRFVSFADAVAALDAYVDGYVSRRKPNAPLTLALGTNNDISVDAAAGATWARALVDPVRAHAARYGVGVVGADDMEPGFNASVAQTRSWLSGYLHATSAGFLFNGSADGCPARFVQGRCNNGWTTGDLHWLAGGASPSRITVLPQVYNTTMAWQWATISNARRVAIVGPLTEWTACSQTRGCASISNVPAWRDLWTALNSRAATRESQMPFGTDLRIN